MQYAWIIDVDHIEPEKRRVEPVIGPAAVSDSFVALLKAGAGRKFRMYDDDGELYYEGRILTQSDGDELFGPLEDYGTPNAGATEIRYLHGREWRTL